VIRLVVMMYVKYPLSLRNVEDLLAERGIDIYHETARLWLNRFGPMFAAKIRRKRVDHMRADTHWRWHPDEGQVKISGEMYYLWRWVVDHWGEVLRRLPQPLQPGPPPRQQRGIQSPKISCLG
jgi:putative transposase